MKRIAVALLFGSLLAASGAQAQVIVRIAPPAPIVERPGPPPHRGYVWINGHHRWDGHRYVWVPGHWASPPRAHAVWVPGRYDHRGEGYYWHEGYWR